MLFYTSRHSLYRQRDDLLEHIWVFQTMPLAMMGDFSLQVYKSCPENLLLHY